MHRNKNCIQFTNNIEINQTNLGVIEEIKFLNLTTTGSYDNKYNYYDFQRDFEKKWLQIFLSGNLLYVYFY